MGKGANISNVEALERFRSDLVVFMERANGALDEVGEEVKRTRIRLETEHRLALQQQMKRKQRELEMLEQEMFSARISGLKTAKTGQQMALNKKRREIHALEATMRRVKGWIRNYDSVVELEARKVEKLRYLFDSDMVKAVSFLSESVRALDDYISGEAPS